MNLPSADLTRVVKSPPYSWVPLGLYSVQYLEIIRDSCIYSYFILPYVQPIEDLLWMSIWLQFWLNFL